MAADHLANQLGLHRAEGAIVAAVQPASSADHSGVERSDMIVDIKISTKLKFIEGIRHAGISRYSVARHLDGVNTV
jgi:S1-C subfamily serine protease